MDNIDNKKFQSIIQPYEDFFNSYPEYTAYNYELVWDNQTCMLEHTLSLLSREDSVDLALLKKELQSKMPSDFRLCKVQKKCNFTGKVTFVVFWKIPNF